MDVRPPRDMIKIGGSDVGHLVTQEPNLADHTLVVGERHQMEDLKCNTSSYLGKFSSGVMRKLIDRFTSSPDIADDFILVLGINKGTKQAFWLRQNRPIRVYHIAGRFGMSTESHFNDSAATLRASFDHVTMNKLNSLLASLQASHQKKMFELCGVDIQSEAAFELAVEGPLRPSVSNIPLVYSLRCIAFSKPNFTIGTKTISSLFELY